MDGQSPSCEPPSMLRCVSTGLSRLRRALCGRRSRVPSLLSRVRPRSITSSPTSKECWLEEQPYWSASAGWLPLRSGSISQRSEACSCRRHDSAMEAGAAIDAASEDNRDGCEGCITMENLCWHRVNSGPWSLSSELDGHACVSSSFLMGEPACDLGVHTSEQIERVHGDEFERWRFRAKAQLFGDAIRHGECRVRSMEALVCDGRENDGGVCGTVG